MTGEPRWKHYYGYCETDKVLVQIEVGVDAGPDATLPPPGEWEDFGLRCPVCGDTVPGGYDGADDATYEAERTLRVRAERALAKAEHFLARVQGYAANCGMMRVEPTSAGLKAALPPSQREVDAILRIPEAERTDAHRERLAEADQIAPLSEGAARWVVPPGTSPAGHHVALLIDAIRDIGVAAGVLREDIEGISGPEALMFAEDTAQHVRALREAAQ